MRMKYARKLNFCDYVWKSSKLLVFLFHCWDIIKFLNAVSELVQQLYHATEIADVVTAVSACADQP